ncbi:type I secretion system permease/ATPase [Blastochloris sulfoviridis]|uniref:Type I secretion system permease/ATPase n=1 Tax=Blastochloris sulfoviridis TaxID=50712 RepID=A0A5M6I2F6_9HYPH|nr:type I secretion system permease/ATPase [Blastochloris sulfoviridis]KAA5602005.1 type I secretion system permease/ATPase [Blastochloris sulfoviridis]
MKDRSDAQGMPYTGPNAAGSPETPGSGVALQAPADAERAALSDATSASGALTTDPAEQGAEAQPAVAAEPGQPKSPVLQQRWRDQDFRSVLTSGLAACRRNLVTVALFSFFTNLIVLAVPIYLFQISDRVMTSRSMDTLVMLTVVVVVAIFLHVFLDMMRRFILMRIAVEAESKLGAPVLSAAAKASQSGSNREYQTLADMQQLRNFITGPVLISMLDAPIAPIYLVAVFLVHPDLGFIVTLTGIALLTIAVINQRLTAVPFSRANAFSTRANLQAEAMARNSQVINAMGMIPEGVAIWGRETAESLKSQVTAQDYNIYMAGLSKFIRLCTQIAILGWGAWLCLHSELTGGMMIAASIVASRALAPIEGTIEGWRGFVQARSAYGRIRSLLQNSPLNFERLRLPHPAGHLTVERILYVPPPNKRVILNGVSFRLEPGESLAIVGNSGAGKSTLAKMLVGSVIPTAGSVRLDSMDLRNWDPRQFGECVGYLPQDVELFPATIKANIARMRADATDEAIFEAAELADVHEMISHFAHGYETTIGVDGSPLSGGQKQRIGLARAFYGRPRLVVLDEPNSNLDVAGERALANALVRAKDFQITVVAITQRPALLRSVDKILILKDGAVQAMGKRDEMLAVLAGNKSTAAAATTARPALDSFAMAET